MVVFAFFLLDLFQLVANISGTLMAFYSQKTKRLISPMKLWEILLLLSKLVNYLIRDSNKRLL